jgi:hypothetical protein
MRNWIEANGDGFNVCTVCMSWQTLRQGTLASLLVQNRGIVRTQAWFIIIFYALESIFQGLFSHCHHLEISYLRSATPIPGFPRSVLC